MFSRRFIHVLIAGSILAACGLPLQTSTLREETPAVEEETSKNPMVWFQNAVRSTVTKLTLTETDIGNFFANRGRFLGFDLSDIQIPINQLVETFAFKKAVLDGAKDKDLFALQFAKELSFEQPDGKILTMSTSVGVTSIEEGEDGILLFNLRGFTYGDQAVKALEWNTKDGAYVHLANEERVEFSIEPFVDFYDENEDNLDSLINKLEEGLPSNRELIAGTLEGLNWFKTTSSDNRIHLPINQNSGIYKMIRSKLDNVVASDGDFARIVESTRQVYVNTRGITIDLSRSAQIDRSNGDQILLNKRMVISPYALNDFSLSGISASEQNRSRWFPVTHGHFKNSGYISFGIIATGPLGFTQRTIHKNFWIPERSQ